MDQEIIKELKNVTALLKKGDAVQARSILVELLKRNPDIEQAWYMLSFATDSKERQIYALRQVLRIDPKNEKAIKRFEKITGEAVYQQERTVVETPREEEKTKEKEYEVKKTKIKEEEEEDRPMWAEEMEEEEGIEEEAAQEAQDDLLSQRLFDDEGASDKKEISKGKKKVEETKGRIIEQKKEEEIPQKEKPNRLRQVLMALLAINLVVLNFLIMQDKLLPLVSNRKGNNVNQQTQTDVARKTENSDGNEEELAVQTPSPTKDVEKTSEPEATNTPGSKNQIPTPIPLEEEAQTAVSSIRSSVASIMEISNTMDVPTELTSKAKIQQITELSLASTEFSEKVAKDTTIYNILGLADSSYSMRTHNLNSWVEPGGGVYSPINQSIYISGFEFGEEESSIYAFEYAQALIDNQFSLEGMGIFPVCQFSTQYCNAVMALVKGEAAFVQEQYGKEKAEGDAFFFDVFAPAAFAEKDLSFSYEIGMEFVRVIYQNGGWDAVNDAYKEPPMTTEQIMHPGKYLTQENAIDVEDMPLSVDLEDDWEEILNDSFGEWETFLFLAYNKNEEYRINEGAAAKAAEGWGGDQIQIYRNKLTNQTIVTLHSVWDTQNDASEYGDALVEKLSLEYGEPEENEGLLCWGEAEINCIYADSNEVIWLAAPNMELIIDIMGMLEI